MSKQTTIASSDEEPLTDRNPEDLFIGRIFNVDQFKVKKLVGDGVFGKVFLVFDLKEKKRLKVYFCLDKKICDFYAVY